MPFKRYQNGEFGLKINHLATLVRVAFEKNIEILGSRWNQRFKVQNNESSIGHLELI
jgi:hypothetical protein